MFLFEIDEAKSQANLSKHGIDINSARKIWEDPDLIEVSVRSNDESRSLVIGRVDQKHWSAVITYHGDQIRIISVRRSRQSEVALYES